MGGQGKERRLCAGDGRGWRKTEGCWATGEESRWEREGSSSGHAARGDTEGAGGAQRGWEGEGGGKEMEEGTRRKLASHGGLEYLLIPTDWLHHRHRLHLLCPTSCLPILDAYPAPSGWRHAQDASGVKLLGCLSLFRPPPHPPPSASSLSGKLLHLHHSSLLISAFLSLVPFLLFFFNLLPPFVSLSCDSFVPSRVRRSYRGFFLFVRWV